MTRRQRLGRLAVVALIASMLAQPGRIDAAGAAGQPAPNRPISWLAAGDSYAAGFGLAGSDGPCHRDETATWPALAHAAVSASLRISRFDFRACTGALTDELFDAAGTRPAQWDGLTRYDLVTFSFGGNDAGFAGVLALCVGGSVVGAVGQFTRFSWLTSAVAGCPPDELGRAAIDAVGGYYRIFLENVANHISATGGNVVVVGYPALIEDPSRWTGTSRFTHLCAGIDQAGARRIRGWVGAMNATIGQAVSDANARRPNGVRFTFVNVQDGVGNPRPHNIDPRTNPNLFEPEGSDDRHNLCATRSWINGINTGLFHPTREGHAAQANVIAPILVNSLDWSGLDASPTGSSPGPAPAPAPTPPTAPPPLSFAVTGTCTSDGGTLNSHSANFTPGGRYSIRARYPDGSNYPLGRLNAGTVRSDGTVVWNWPCAGDPPGAHSTELIDEATGRTTGPVPFTVGTSASTTPPPPPPTTTTTTTGATQPSERTVTISNLVTNGSTQMREDSSPAYLSTVTRNFCKRDGCALPGTDMTSGFRLTVYCQSHGDRTTNGQDNSTIDDHNPGLYTTTLWYGARWSDGRTGFISEAWIAPSDRGGLGVRAC